MAIPNSRKLSHIIGIFTHHTGDVDQTLQERDQFGEGNSSPAKIINRTNVPREPQKDINTTEDFLQVICTAHIIAAALENFGMQSVSDSLNPQFAVDTKSLFYFMSHETL